MPRIVRGGITIPDQIMRVIIDKVQFPRLCPVCARDADAVTTVILTERTFLDASPSSDMLVKIPRIAGRYKYLNYSPAGGMKRTIRVPTCGRHRQREIKGEYKSYWFALTLLLFAPILFLLYGTTNAIYYGGNVLLNLVGLLLLVGAVSVSTAFIYWPRPFQRAFEILDFMPNDLDIFLRLKNTAYMENFLSLNEMFVDVITEKEYLEMKKSM